MYFFVLCSFAFCASFKSYDTNVSHIYEEIIEKKPDIFDRKHFETAVEVVMENQLIIYKVIQNSETGYGKSDKYQKIITNAFFDLVKLNSENKEIIDNILDALTTQQRRVLYQTCYYLCDCITQFEIKTTPKNKMNYYLASFDKESIKSQKIYENIENKCYKLTQLQKKLINYSKYFKNVCLYLSEYNKKCENKPIKKEYKTKGKFMQKIIKFFNRN